MKNIIILLMSFLCITTGSMAQTGDLLLKNGTLLTITNGVIEETDILIRNGKITQIGKNLSAPQGVKVLDITGHHVMPGIIDAHSHIALSAINEATDPVTADVHVGDALNPLDVSIYRALAGGVTSSHAMHGSANAIGGQCQTIKHRYGVTNPNALVMEGAPRTIKFALGENPMRVHGEGYSVLPRTRMGVEQVIRNAFGQAVVYRQEWSDFKSGKRQDPPQHSEKLQTMVDILNGDVIIHCHSYRADEILMLINVLNDYGVKKICFQHVNEGFKVAPELAAYGASASVFADWWAYKFEVYYSTAYNAAILAKNGVITSINSDSGELIRHLYHEAAKTQRYGGLSDVEALKLITLHPAIQLGIENRVGSIEVGKDADLAVFKGHPLSIYAIPQYTIVDGIVRFDINDDAIDMRIDIDPTEAIPAFIDHSAEDHDRCMHGIYDILLLRD
ncbi:MAG TPA: amidohydrolase family protein [Saprospiraceae bacterium]|nr:amidohydrolase family protein [Saprospiraceae bacterium]